MYSIINDTLPENLSQRCSKFSEQEHITLTELIRKYKHVIMCKQTGKVNPKLREETWQKILTEFNAHPATTMKRNTVQLKNKWDHIKRMAKKEVAQHKKSLISTGGGPPPPPLRDSTNFLLDTVGETIEGSSSSFDRDQITQIHDSTPYVLVQDSNETTFDIDVIVDTSHGSSPDKLEKMNSCIDDCDTKTTPKMKGPLKRKLLSETQSNS